MKTKIFNPIVIAALSILSLNLSAQNTKSINVALKHEKNLLAMSERKNAILVIKENLDYQLSKLAEYVKYNPGTITPAENTEPFETSSWSSISEELKKEVKFIPTKSILLKYEQEMLAEEITNELKPMVKYNPSQSSLAEQYETENEIATVLNELETFVKYKPTAIQ